MKTKKNVSREDIAEAIYSDFGFNNIFDIIIEGLQTSNVVKIHNFGTFKLNKKNSRIGRNPKTKEEYIINSRYVVTFKASKILINNLNKTIVGE